MGIWVGWWSVVVIKEAGNCPRRVIRQGHGSEQISEKLRDTRLDVTMGRVIGCKRVHKKGRYRDGKRT